MEPGNKQAVVQEISDLAGCLHPGVDEVTTWPQGRRREQSDEVFTARPGWQGGSRREAVADRGLKTGDVDGGA